MDNRKLNRVRTLFKGRVLDTVEAVDGVACCNYASPTLVGGIVALDEDEAPFLETSFEAYDGLILGRRMTGFKLVFGRPDLQRNPSARAELTVNNPDGGRWARQISYEWGTSWTQPIKGLPKC